MVFSPDGRTLAASLDGTILIVEMASAKVRLSFAAKSHAFAYSADARFLAAAMDDTTALIWDLAALATGAKK
jgi:hypothetical protein